MEGLLIAEQLRRLAPSLPATRLPWRFPDDRTAVLPLQGHKSLLIASRPPNPAVQLMDGAPVADRPRSPFQELLQARAAGRLLSASQPRLDRVLRLEFAGEEAFVPTPPVTLVIELTGRNANLVLLDESGLILGVERQVLVERNRYRQLRVGLPYTPPPPYSKLDPRGAGQQELVAALSGTSLRQVARRIDGVGPNLAAALLRAVQAEVGAAADEPLQGTPLQAAARLLGELTVAPADFLQRHGSGGGPLEQRDEARREQQLGLLRAHAQRRQKLARRRLEDAQRASEAASGADTLRQEGDLLLAYAHLVPPGADSATLTDFSGKPLVLKLDPRRDAAGNANQRYEQARRRAARAERARQELPRLQEELTTADAELARLPQLGDADLARLAQELASGAREQRRGGAQPGIRFQGPHGFEVVVGRNARDNDKVTFGVGRSRDLWLHAQGYRGSHVIVRSGGKEVPFETVLFAARLAAGYSEAFRSDNVPVDYTSRKNVWKVKGGAPGAVNFTQHRTVYVTPARDDQGAAGTA